MALILPPVFPCKSTDISECILIWITQKPLRVQTQAAPCFRAFYPLKDFGDLLLAHQLWAPSLCSHLGSSRWSSSVGVLQCCTQTRSLRFLPVVLFSAKPAAGAQKAPRAPSHPVCVPPGDIGVVRVGMVWRWDLLVQTGLDAPWLLKSNWQPSSKNAARYLQKPSCSSLENIWLILMFNSGVFSVCLEDH